MQSKFRKSLKNLKSKKLLRDPRSSLVIFLVFLLALNYLVSQTSWYLDLTQDKIYTASDTSRNILSNLKNPVQVTFYISKELPSNDVVFKSQIQDLLNQYQDLSRGKLLVRYETPGSDDKTVQDLAKKGIPQLQSQVVEKDNMEVKNFFFGAEIAAGEGGSIKKEVLPTLPRMESFEYDFVSAVYSVSKEQKELVAFMSGHGEKEIGSTELAKSYEVAKVAISTESSQKGFYIADSSAQSGLPTSTASASAAPEKKFITPKTLIIAGPQSKLGEGEISSLNDFVAGGGRVIVLAEQVNPDLTQGFVTKNIDNNVSDFTKRYGIELNNDLVYDKSNAPLSVGYYTFDYPFWVKAVKENFSDNPALAKVQSVTFLWASSLKTGNADGYDVKNLITSSADAALVSENYDITPTAKLSFALSGKKTLAAVASAKSGDGKVIVIGDSDFVSPSFMQPVADNEIFFMNLVDSITSSVNLSSIRNKNIDQRPLKNMDEGEKNSWKFFAIFGGTIILGVYGFVRISKRKKQSRA